MGLLLVTLQRPPPEMISLRPRRSPFSTSSTRAPSPAASGPCAAVRFQTDIQPWMQAKCAHCHYPSGPGRDAFFNADKSTPNMTLLQKEVGEVIDRVASGSMPKDAPGTVTAEEIAA